MNTLKKGNKGNDVKKLQSLLGIDSDGIFGGKTEEIVKKFQKDNGLTDDGIVGSKTWKLLEQQNSSIDKRVIYNPIYKHITKCQNRKIEYLVIHFTAGTKSTKGCAENNRAVFLKRDASADFVVDDETILQVNPDPKNYYCWAVGDGKGKNGITNKNAINIEICSSLKPKTTSAVPNHDGWYFTEDSVSNALCLTKIIMENYNIPFKNIVRHFDASGKLCPGIIGWNTGKIYDSVTGKYTGHNNTEEKWIDFKNHLAEEQ